MKGPAAPVPRLVMAKAMPKKKALTEAMKRPAAAVLRRLVMAKAMPKKKAVTALSMATQPELQVPSIPASMTALHLQTKTSSEITLKFGESPGGNSLKALAARHDSLDSLASSLGRRLSDKYHAEEAAGGISAADSISEAAAGAAAGAELAAGATSAATSSAAAELADSCQDMEVSGP